MVHIVSEEDKAKAIAKYKRKARKYMSELGYKDCIRLLNQGNYGAASTVAYREQTEAIQVLRSARDRFTAISPYSERPPLTRRQKREIVREYNRAAKRVADNSTALIAAASIFAIEMNLSGLD